MKKKSSKVDVKSVQPVEEPKVASKKLVMKSFCAWDGETLVLNVLGTPSAKQDAIGKPKGHQLKISVTATYGQVSGRRIWRSN